MKDTQDQYRTLLIEIKRRTEVIDALLMNKVNTLYNVTTTESVCLQIRKILELIAFGSLVANIKVFSSEYKKFAKYWNASLMLKDMERINPNFYPRPVNQVPSKRPGIKTDMLEMKKDYLTQKDFIKIYEKCGAILHANNPYGKQINYKFYDNNLLKWRNKIFYLMNAHTITLIDEPENMYLFQMGAKGENPSYVPFGYVGPADEEPNK